MITQEYLKTRLDYAPETGEFTWRNSRKGDWFNGRLAGYTGISNYRVLSIDRVLYLEHRLAWLYVYGKFPTEMLDHIDGNPSNNKLSNLREATRRQNCINSKIRSNNTSGFKGVSKSGKKWVARIKDKEKYLYLGLFLTPEEASEVYNQFAEDLHGNFYRDTTKENYVSQ